MVGGGLNEIRYDFDDLYDGMLGQTSAMGGLWEVKWMRAWDFPAYYYS